MKTELWTCPRGGYPTAWGLKPGTYRVRFKDGRAYLYGARNRRVWGCNETFLREHFVKENR